MAKSFGESVTQLGCGLTGCGCMMVIVGGLICGVVLLALAGAG